MRQRAYCFLVVLLLMFSGSSSAQKIDPKWGKNSPLHFKNSTTFKIRDLGYSAGKDESPCINRMLYVVYDMGRVAPCGMGIKRYFVIDLADYLVDQLGFFCKKEIEFEKATSIPLRFRLGSLDYVNKIEGKFCD